MNSKFEKPTPENLFINRRLFMKKTLLTYGLSQLSLKAMAEVNKLNSKLNEKYKSLNSKDSITKEEIALSYNNFYEFSLEKDEVKKKVEKWNLDKNWKIEVSGLVEKPQIYNLEDLISLSGGKLEQRLYRFRCVEAWSMVVPWDGFQLSSLVEKLKPKKNAKFIKFQSFSDKKIGPNQSLLPQYPWPYTEGLTIEEALNPLSLIATGMYNKSLPKQNGAPLRLIVPWKYGFKNIKSIVKIEFTDTQPKTLWNQLAPDEYGFYANVNPNVAHPRWSQETERILDTGFFPKRKPTLLFNGYENEVSYLYKGLDLKKNY